MSGTHVLLDYENVQPTEAQLRALVPDASQVWVFHGPHHRRVEARFASFGADVTAVPISKTGKNALDFHLSFYIGYIASRNQASAMVVVANDKGYEPMLEHARSMGFAARQVGHGRVKPAASVKTASAATPAAKKAPAKKASAKKVPAKKVAAKPAAAPPAKKAVVPTPAVAVKAPASVNAGTKAVALLPDSAATIKKLTDGLRKMGDKRPTKPASLRRSLKSFLGVGASEESAEVALARLIEDGVVKVDSVKGASYPRFDVRSGSTVSQS
jgi:hypothetical protein